MPEIILITLAKNLFHILKNEVGNHFKKRPKHRGKFPKIDRRGKFINAPKTTFRASSKI